MRISHSKVELYNTCGMKYRFRYVDKIKVDQTAAALLFGGACDKAFNYLLLRTKHKKIVFPEVAKKIFLKKMNTWKGQNELVFFKSELPENGFQEDDPVGNQDRCFEHLCSLGQKMIDVFYTKILPLFKEIISVQTKKVIKNLENDELVLVTDFVAKLHDDRVVLFDNKTTSDLKTYSKNAVKKSQQLSLYVEYEQNRLAGYICFQKKLVNNEVVWKYIIDEIPEEQSIKSFELIDQTLRNIKAEKFEKNQKNCMMFGKKCEYWDICKYPKK